MKEMDRYAISDLVYRGYFVSVSAVDEITTRASAGINGSDTKNRIIVSATGIGVFEAIKNLWDAVREWEKK